VNVPGVTREARKRARKRLGADLSGEQWASILADKPDAEGKPTPVAVSGQPLEREVSR
jgi:hypothetical protein